MVVAMVGCPRRAALLLPALLLPRRSHAGRPVPPFPEWVGRTARLKSDAGHARLLLAGDGTGLIAVRAFLVCRPLPVLSWRIAESGRAMFYRRQSALFAGRVIEGSARIDPATETVHWLESREQLAEFEGFEAAELAGHCG